MTIHSSPLPESRSNDSEKPGHGSAPPSHDSASPGCASTSPGPARRGWFGQFLRRLHFYAGIFVGPFILVAALSGALYALSPQLEKLVYADELSVPPAAETLPLADQVSAADNYIGPGHTISAVRPAPEPGATTRVMYADPELGESESRAVFVNPATAEVTGDLTVYGTSGALPLRTWIDQLHRGLHLGDFGRYYSELAASWLGIIAAAGLGLWVTRFVKARRKSTLLHPTTRHKGLRRTLSWHASVGVWVGIGMLFLSATGITWSQLGGDNVTKLREALDWTAPAVSTDLAESDGASGAGEHAHHQGAGDSTEADTTGPAVDPGDFDMMLSMARQINIDSTQVEILPPEDASQAWVVQEIQRSYPTQVDAVAFDPDTMEVTDQVDFSDYGHVSKLARWGIDIHMGTMFGLANQIVMFLVAIAIAAMVVWGYVMWWQRRPKHDPSRRFGITPARGVLRGAPWWGVAAVVVGAVAVGVLLPLVGLSLIAFVVVDVLLGARARRRSRS
ncbi:PepSY-associated TM helix domain-containing protein [Brevibacterium sp. GP-SGM9]|uniref:PepSY-associated TM helix domain-containing protein n=1 Tax=Brevibacterium sp. GP-SGM9 TaxID=3376990 RepID=UPI0039A45D48